MNSRIESLIVLGLLVLVSRVLVSLAVKEPPEVNTNFGRVKGLWLSTVRHREIAGFIGLPYAEPPVGDLRFENPRLWTEKWNETKNATEDQSACAQGNVGSSEILGSEDCLYINVFTPVVYEVNDTTTSGSERLPVIVYVHGGSFNFGSSNTSKLAPTYLLDHDVVLVTFNYRLNVFGFFSTGNAVTPGNYGLKDQVAALHWVQNNIEAFGGDPRSVTLVGISAGAASVHLLATSNATENLFHKIITMSGVATASWAFHTREDIRNSSMVVAKRLLCDIESILEREELEDYESNGNDTELIEENSYLTEDAKDQKVLECLKKADYKKLVQAGYWFEWRGNPACYFGPTLEAEADGAVITTHPDYSLKHGQIRDIPWISGLVNDEGLVKTSDLFLMSQLKEEFLENFDSLLPYVLELQNNIEDFNASNREIVNFYFNGELDPELFDENITEMIGDGIMAWPTYEALKIQSAKMKSNAYFYVFSYEGTFSNTFRWDIPFHFGVAHGDDANYLFPILNKKFEELQLMNTLGDITMINIMCELFSSFAQTGVPSARLTTEWEPFQKAHRFLRLGSDHRTDINMESNFLPERMSFWSELMSNYSRPVREIKVGLINASIKNTSQFTIISLLLTIFIHLFFLSIR
ncbi:hypothetical protein TKK_0007738 [Trichogramma kaykai]|uniref:Carboxylic ester hydrolase n=1 Tax=Trichogramma kaykai TaxID=54128 RepID=A0ABD2X724_9HYME